jgi:uncharacterized membrane protein (DUF4010 family)
MRYCVPQKENAQMKPQYWAKPVITLLALALATWFAPTAPIDPWNLLSPKKIAMMILALAVIQAFGSSMAQYLGTRTGALLTGLFGGLISSTATTASLARRSNIGKGYSSGETLTFLSATGAMLFEGLALVITGTSQVHLSNLLIFIGPLLATLVMIFLQYKKLTDKSEQSKAPAFLILPILKLSLFIVAILSVSKLFQNLFGQNGLLVITSLVSLFEIHGSVIANVQLHELGAVSTKFLCSLLAISVVASYISKIFIIWTLGSSHLKANAIKCTVYLLLSLAASWGLAMKIS